MDNAFKCTSCNQHFGSISTRDVHVRSAHRLTYTLKLNGGDKQVLHKSPDGKFHCPVTTCGSSYKLGTKLGEHHRKMHSVLQRQGGSANDEIVHMDELDAKEGLCILPDPSSTPLPLSTLNLHVVRRGAIVFLVCLTCNSALPNTVAKSVMKHIRSHGRCQKTGQHPVHLDGSTNELSTSLRDFSFTPPTAPDILCYTTAPTSSLLSPVPGIIIHSGFACRRCVYYCGAKRSMANHRLDHHNNESTVDISVPCKVQILAQRIGNKYYGVQHQDVLPDNISTSANLKELVLREFGDHCKSLRPEQAPPVVQLTPWLRLSRWHEFAGEFMPEGIPFLQVKGQLLPPSKQDKSPFSYVSQLVYEYMKRLQRLIVEDVNYTLRIMVKQRAASEAITTGFSPLQEESTITSYCALKASFILALLRSSVDENVPASYVIRPDRDDDLRDALEALKMQLEQLDEDSIKNAQLSDLHRVLRLLWTPGLPETLQAEKSSDCVFIRFLILQSMERVGDDPTSEGFAFRDVRHLTRPMAILKYWGRGILLMELAQVHWHPDPRSHTWDDVNYLLQYFRDGPINTPFIAICQALRLARNITQGTPTIPRLVPMGDSHTACQIDGDVITLSQFSSMVESIIVEARAVMDHRVLLGLRTKWVERLLQGGPTVHDDANLRQASYSFINDPGNQTFEEHRKDLLLHMFDGDMMRAHFVSGQTDQEQIVWNKKALRNWMADSCRLEELLTLLLHFTTGLPPRGEEYRSLLIRNTTTGARSFFWSNNTLMIFQSYHKGANGGAPVKLIARFLPTKLRSLFLAYLCLVRPVQCFSARILWGTKEANMYRDSWFVSMDKIRKGNDLSNSIQDAFEKHCGVSLGISEYRHIATFFATNIREQHKRILQDPVDEAGGHTTETAGHHYAQSEKDLRKVDSHLMRAFQLISENWQRLLEGSTSGEFVDIPRGNSVVNTIQHPDDQLEITRQTLKRPRITVQFPPAFANEAYSSKEVDPLTCISSHDASMRACTALTKLGHKKWTSSEQGVAVSLAIENHTDFVAILPTGGGKSAIFMAPSTLIDPKTVIVVVPLQILIKSHIRECEKARISCALYQDGKIEVGRPPAIIFVSVEIAAQSDSFRVVAEQLRNANRLHSVVFDEVHLLLSDFRPVMRALLRLMCLEVQVIGLTASLSPKRQVDLKVLLATEMIWLRCPTIRPNIEYTVVEVKNIDEEVVTKLQTWVGSALLQDRALVYCMTREEVLEMARKLQMKKVPCTYMHAGLDKDERAKALKCWESDAAVRKVLVATGVIGCGYNYKSVRLVIHVGSFNSLEAFHQESGRAGRDGSAAESYVVSSHAYRERAVTKNTNLQLSHEWIVNRSQCRRFGLHREVDGKSQMCYLIPDAVACDICSKMALDLPATETPVAMETEVSPTMQSQGPSTHARRSSTDQHGLPPMNPEPMITMAEGQQGVHHNKSSNTGAQISSTLVARIRPTMVKQKLQAVAHDLRTVREFAGDGSKCLICKLDPVNDQHEITKCRQLFNCCIKCLGAHRGQACPNRFPNTNDACYKCHFQRSTNIRAHAGGYGRECDDFSGERLRLFIWRAWRTNDLKSRFCKTFPELRGKCDKEFAVWIMTVSAGNTLNNFVHFAAAAVRLQFPEKGRLD